MSGYALAAALAAGGRGLDMMRQLRTVAKMWYRADGAAANAGCALLAGYPAGLLKARGVSAGVISRGTASGGELVVAWANE